MLPQDERTGQGQRERALPVVDNGLGAASNGVVGSASGAGAATTVGAGLGFFFFAACAGGGACSGEAASAPGSVGGLSSGFGAEASATGASWITTVPPLQAVRQISKIGCSTPCRPGLSANIQPEKMRLVCFSSSISSTWAKASVCGASVGGRE